MGTLMTLRTDPTMPGRKLPAFAGPTDIAGDDWDVLFRAVIARLRRTAAAQPSVTNDEHALEVSSRLRADVLDCVTALEQLHDTMSHHLARQRLLERDFDELRAELTVLRRRFTDLLAPKRSEHCAGV
jgi:hypothetical protein